MEDTDTADAAAVARVDEIVKILENKLTRGEAQAVIYRFETERDAFFRLRSRGSEASKQALLSFRTALHKLRTAYRGLPEDFRLLLDLRLNNDYVNNSDDCIKWLDAHTEWIGKEILKESDGTVRFNSKGKIATRQLTRKRAADDKRIATEYALRTLEQCKFSATKTKGGQFERLAAAIHGDKRAGGFNQHCRKLLDEQNERSRLASAKMP